MKRHLIKIFILITILSLSRIHGTNAYYSSGKVLSGNTFSTGYWLPPNTDITNTDVISDKQTFQINYTTEYLDNLDYVQLCYSYDLGNFICPSNSDFKNKSGVFNFTANKDGIYQFYTQSQTVDGKTEDINRFGKNKYTVQIDTTPPASNFSFKDLPNNSWTGSNLIRNDSWTSIGSGQHHLVHDQDLNKDVFLIGYRDSLPSSIEDNGIYQTLFLPQNSVSNLSFKYRLLSNDYPDFSNFFVQVRGLNNQVLDTILLNGNTNVGTSLDSGWLSLGRSILSFDNQNINLWFGISNQKQDNPQQTWVYLDDIKVSTIDPRVGKTFPVTIISNDLGSGTIIQSTSQNTLNQGENDINFRAVDAAINSESKKKQDLVVVSSLALNKIYFSSDHSTIELYNNTSTNIDLTGFYLENGVGSTYPINSLSINIPDTSDFKLNQTQNILYLKNANNEILDQITYQSFDTSKTFQRSPVGIGSWGFINNPEPQINLNIFYRSAPHKILLSVFDIPKDLNNFNYEIIYTSGLSDKGIYGQINQNEIIDSKADREFYLGVCSTGGVCVSDSNIGSTITVNLTQKTSTTTTNIISKTFAINP